MASLACLVHCLALPLVLALLPSLSAALDLPEEIHGWLLLFAVPTSAIALGAGYRETRSATPPLLGAIGLGFMGLGYLLFARTTWETVLTVCGASALAGAHIQNWRNRHARYRHG